MRKTTYSLPHKGNVPTQSLSRLETDEEDDDRGTEWISTKNEGYVESAEREVNQ